MFGPEGVEDRLVSRAQLAEERSNAPPKGVNYGGTRFSEVTAEPEIPVPPSPSMSAIDAAIAGRPKATQSEVGYSGAETPRINGYAFVDAEPTPSELALPVTEEEEREAAKSLLPKVDDTGPNPFNIKERSKREDLHHKLVEKADAGRRKGGRMDQLRSLGITPGRTLTPKFPSGANTKSGKGSGMTPAARALANRIGTPRREADLFGSSKPECGTWTPTPQNQR
jgi:protein DGCR14